MDKSVRAKCRNCTRAEEKVAGGFREVAVAQRTGQISGFLEVRPDAVHATLPAVVLSNRNTGFVDQPDPGTNQLGVRMSSLKKRHSAQTVQGDNDHPNSAR